MKREYLARAVGIGLSGTGLFLFAATANAAPAPDGSYQQSCRNFAASRGVLSAECKNRNGDWGSTQLDEYRRCSGDISNNNGQLTCQKDTSGQGHGGSGGQGAGAVGGQGTGGAGGQGAGASGGQGSGGSGGQGSGAAGGQGSGGSGGQGSGAAGGQGSGGTGGQGSGGTGGQGSGVAGGQGSGGAGGQGAGGSGGQGSGAAGGQSPGGYGGSGGQGSVGDREHRDGDNAAPQGSYKDTCRNIHFDGDTLVAECRTRDGEWHRTSLDTYRECRGDISNDDGRLRCQRGDDRGGRGDGDRGGGYQPRGSYEQTCREIRVDHGDLAAECRTRDGDWRRTTLDNYRECQGDIVNDDGRLRCRRAEEDHGGRGDDGRGGYGGGGYEPRGSYQQTCRDIRLDHGVLEAECRTRFGDWRHSSLDNARDCRGDIANNNGRLVCSDGGGGGGYGYARITLYKDSRFRGSSRAYDSDTPDLGGFADTASSAYIQGGVWQLCTRRFYRGRCVTFDHNVSNFVSFGINDRVESLRRVR